MMTIEEMNLRRGRIGATYQQICFESGIPLSTVQKVLGKVTPNPRMSTMLRLEEAIIQLEHKYADHHQETEEGGNHTAAFHTADHITMTDHTEQNITNLKETERRPSLTAMNQKTVRLPGTCLHNDEMNSSDREELVREPGAVYGSKKAMSDKESPVFTAQERNALPPDRRTELIDGVLYDMAAPSVAHQTISRMLLVQLDQCIREHHSECRVYDAPIDVYLDQDEYTVVMPDIVVVCDQRKITWKNIQGAPDFIIEILSPSTMRRDEFTKLAKYAQAGVREYWLVNPVSRKVVTYDLQAGEMRLQQEETEWAARMMEADAPSDGAVAYETCTYDFDAKIPVRISGGKCLIDMKPIRQEMDRLWGKRDAGI